MLLPQLPVLVGLAALASASPMRLEERSAKCPPAVVFAVRPTDTNQTTLGYNPRYNILPTAMNDTANAVVKKAGGKSYVDYIQYPAINPATGMYPQSVQMGITALQGAITNYTNECPVGQVFVMGYSQGAQVMSSALGGSPPLSLAAQARITAGVLYADPHFIDFFEPLNQGNGDADGINGTSPGGQPLYAYLNSNYTQRLRSYCEVGDQFCDSGTGPNAHNIHLNATEYFAVNATKFLLKHDS